MLSSPVLRPGGAFQFRESSFDIFDFDQFGSLVDDDVRGANPGARWRNGFHHHLAKPSRGSA